LLEVSADTCDWFAAFSWLLCYAFYVSWCRMCHVVVVVFWYCLYGARLLHDVSPRINSV